MLDSYTIGPATLRARGGGERSEGGMIRYCRKPSSSSNLSILAFRAQISQFELFELIILLRLDKQFSIEQFEPTASQSAASSPPSQKGTATSSEVGDWCQGRDLRIAEDVVMGSRKGGSEEQTGGGLVGVLAERNKKINVLGGGLVRSRPGCASEGRAAAGSGETYEGIIQYNDIIKSFTTLAILDYFRS